MASETLQEKTQLLSSATGRLRRMTGRALRQKWGRSRQDRALRSWRDNVKRAYGMRDGAAQQVPGIG